MNPVELPELPARFAQPAENLAVQRQLVDAARLFVRREQVLRLAARDAQRPGRGVVGLVRPRIAQHRLPRLVERHVEQDGLDVVAVRVELLDAAVRAVGDVDEALAVDLQAVRQAELAVLGAVGAPRLEPVPVLVHLADARIHVAVADVDVAVGVPADVGRPLEVAVDMPRLARVDVLVVVEALGAPAEVHRDVAGGVELGDRVGPLVDDPQVVVVVEPHRVPVPQPVDASADLAHEVALVVELEQVRGGVAVERSGGGGAGVVQQDDVALRVLGHRQGLAEVHGRRVLQEVGHRHEGDLRRVLRLGARRRRTERQRDGRRNDDETSHATLLGNPGRRNGIPDGRRPT